MGCDIHGLWELKTPEGKWVAFRYVNDTRSYTWFALIADVRGRAGSETSRRGIPDDASAAWNQYCQAWGNGLHSHTWLTPSEVMLANKRLYAFYKADDNGRKDAESCLYLPDDALHHADGHYHETVPMPEDLLDQIILAGADQRHTLMQWTGTIAENAHTDDIWQSIRLVVAFDN